MADPFEVRMRFTTLLSHLSASTTSQIKAAHYALKHRDMDEDLHSCILENLEQGKNNMNNRANIMYFLEHHADVNLREGGHSAYLDMVRRDLGRIVDSVAQSGANVKVARRVVGVLREKGVLPAKMVEGIEVDLKVKEEQMGDLLEQENTEAALEAVAEAPMEGVVLNEKVTPRRESKSATKREITERDRKAIEQRIEEDRMRNKRLREDVWAVSGDDDEELEKMWEEGSDVGEDDYVIAQEEAEERLTFARYHRATFESAST
ncbi:CTD kinase subunit gamma [Cyphellophora attinorum]|uniref:CTD kinase subunit gamma n=1 Tax=Cyphellophora attinorum TaxID=1664694 RepID=A0A0N1HA42_9EURO|nr:CTD kinase subunit gamma [Phialophora attinorum]KPI39317.1 CTD kinase subunit gamma [Phialophora attinorum]